MAKRPRKNTLVSNRRCQLRCLDIQLKRPTPHRIVMRRLLVKNPLECMCKPQQQERALVSLRQRTRRANGGVHFLSSRREISRRHPGLCKISLRMRGEFRRSVFHRKRSGFRQCGDRPRFVARAGKQNADVVLHLRNQSPRLELSCRFQCFAEQRFRVRGLPRKHQRSSLRGLNFREQHLSTDGLRLLFQLTQCFQQNLVLPDFAERLDTRQQRLDPLNAFRVVCHFAPPGCRRGKIAARSSSTCSVSVGPCRHSHRQKGTNPNEFYEGGSH